MGIDARTVAKPPSFISTAKRWTRKGLSLHSIMGRFPKENIAERTINGVTRSARF